MRRRRKLSHPREVPAVVDICVVLEPVIDVADVLLQESQTRQHPLADRHARHDDHELRKAILLAELGDRAQVDVRLSGAGLHLDAEVQAGTIHPEPLPVRLRDRGEERAVVLQQRPVLDSAQIRLDRCRVERQSVAECDLLESLQRLCERAESEVDEVLFEGLLPGEQFDDACDRV